MRLVVVAEARGEVAGGGDDPQLRDVEVGLLGVAAQVDERGGEELLGARMVREAGLERTEDLHVLLDREVFEGPGRVQGAEGRGDELPREVGRARARTPGAGG